MACFWLNQDDIDVIIPKIEIDDGVIYYIAKVKVNDVTWYIRHRYNDFYDLHQQLVVDHGVSKDSLPPKKAINNKCPIFIQQRREGLETYLRNTLNYLKRTMPRIFTRFLDFHKYDTFFLLQHLAFVLYTDADNVLRTSSKYTFDILQVIRRELSVDIGCLWFFFLNFSCMRLVSVSRNRTQALRRRINDTIYATSLIYVHNYATWKLEVFKHRMIPVISFRMS